MSALTVGLESARRRSTASDRENLMEGRTYIPRMSKEQKALLIAALQAGAKKRAEKRGKPLSNDEVVYIIQEYLSGSTIDSISNTIIFN